MSTQNCLLCNTELLENLISCSGRCNKFFHYTCVGLTRTTFDVYKKVDGLRWQCTDCTNDFKGIWSKLDDLSTTVNEIKSMISLGGLVKAAISEVFRDNGPVICSSVNQHVPSVDRHMQKQQRSVKKNHGKSKRPKGKRKKIAQSSTPNVSIIQSTTSMHSQTLSTHSPLDSESVSSNATVVPNTVPDRSDQMIRTAEKRTYLWLNGFHHESTSNQVINLVASTMNVQGSEIVCRSLKSSRRNYTDFDQISFRIGLKSSDVKDALTTDRWPKGVVCKLFNSKNSNIRQPVKLG